MGGVSFKIPEQVKNSENVRYMLTSKSMNSTVNSSAFTLELLYVKLDL